MKTAIIVGVLLPNDDAKLLQDDLTELESLLKTLGIVVVGQIVQKRAKLTPNCLIGTGKVDEIRDIARDLGAGILVVDRELSPPQVRNLELMTKCKIMDRGGVILDIFSQNARTTAAKTQVEIARLEMMLPRIVGQWTHLHRQGGGGAVGRSDGEKQIEVDRRRARDRIIKLKEQLLLISRDRVTQSKARRHEIKVALVGYTNSGKTTIMNALTNGNFLAKDALFATLDSNVRTIEATSRPKMLLSDTVGFIRNLPHTLVESFKSTLDHVLEADLLLLVVDIAHENYQSQLETTKGVLAEIGASDIPVIHVFNKIDQVEDVFMERILKHAYPGSLCISAHKTSDTHRLREAVYKFFEVNFIHCKFAVPSTDIAGVSLVYQNCTILSADYERQNLVVFDVHVTKDTYPKLAPYRLQTEEASTL